MSEGATSLDPVVDLARQVRSLKERLAQTEAEVARLSEEAAGNAGHRALWLRPPIADLEPEEQAAAEAEAWQEFIEWVVLLQRRYELPRSRLPNCWDQHPGVIEELVALWIGHDEAYAVGGRSPGAWHDALERTLGRIRAEWAGGCRTGGHTADGAPQQWTLGSYASIGTAGPPTEHPRRPGSYSGS